MNPDIQTREEAIAWLIEQGFDSGLRDWGLGRAIYVAADKTIHEGGIVGWRYMLIISNESEHWTVMDLATQRPDELRFETLQEAAFTAKKILDDHLRKRVSMTLCLSMRPS